MLRRAWPILGTCLLLLAQVPAVAQERRVYLADDDHTDYMWSADEATYRQAFIEMLDYAMARAEATRREPAPWRHRFNADGHFWLWEYQQARPPLQFLRLLDHVKKGNVGVPLNALALCYGGMPAEAVLRSMYYAGRLERRHGLRFETVTAVENQTLPGGLVSLWAGSGARWAWHGICHCATRIDVRDREHEIYHWEGLDGRRLLMKWNSMPAGNEGMGGYMEARDPEATLDLILGEALFQRRYPWSVIGAFGRGGDDLKTTKDDFPAVARRRSRKGEVQVIVSNRTDFFQDLEATHGPRLPRFRGGFGNEWDLLCASMGEVTARVRRATEKLRTAEALATMVLVHNAAALADRRAERDRACNNLGLYFEHDWTSDGPVSRQQRADWQRRLAGEIDQYVESLHAEALREAGKLVPVPRDTRRIMVFNPLSWRRHDVVEADLGTARPFHLLDLSTGRVAKHDVAGPNRVRFLAADLPPLGYKVYEAVEGARPSGRLIAARGSVLASEHYEVEMDNVGQIVRLLARRHGGRDLVGHGTPTRVNSCTQPAIGNVAIRRVGTVSSSLRAALPGREGSPPRQVTVTLYDDLDRVDIENEIQGGFGDTQTWDFAFDLRQFVVHHEEVGAIARVGRASKGGFYADRNTRTDHLTLGHFVDLSEERFGITLSSADSPFFQLGNSDAKMLDTLVPLVRAVVGMQVDGPKLGIPQQGGDRRFLNRYALRAHAAYSAAEAMRFALEHQNPAVALPLAENPRGPLPAATWSMLSVDNPQVVVWAIKPAEEGIEHGVILRLWNVGNTAAEVRVTPAFAKAFAAARTSHIETDQAPAMVEGGVLADRLPGQWMQTYRIRGQGEGPRVQGLKSSNVLPLNP